METKIPCPRCGTIMNVWAISEYYARDLIGVVTEWIDKIKKENKV